MQTLSSAWHHDHPAEVLNKYTMMPHVAWPASEDVFGNRELIKTAFRISGIYPWDKSAVHWEKLEAGSLYTDKTSEESEKLLPAVENEVDVMEADSAEVGVSSDWAHNIADPSTHTSNHPTGADIANFVPHN